MSMLLEKAMTSLGSLFSPLGTSTNLKQMFERCVKARTKKEEEWLVQDCLQIVKNRLQEPSTTPAMVTRGLAFVIFADMLGYKCEFAQIHAVKLAQFGSLCEKKIGYLSCIFLMKASDPLAVMVMNTILRDLGSKNILVVAMAASASCYLIPTNLASTVLPLLAEKLTHPSEFLRSKAVIVFHHFLRLCPEHCCYYLDSVCALLGDKDPCVVGYVLQFLLDVAKVNKTILIKCIPLLINIQHQILAGKLPEVHNYRGMSAPWMQITLMKLLQFSDEYALEIAALCHKTWEMLKGAEKFPLQGALKIECLKTLIHCEGGETNFNLAMGNVEELLSCNSWNLRYAGLDLLQAIIQHYKIPLPSEKQQFISTLLEYPDTSVKNKALHLLCVSANENNVHIVCSQVVDNARACCGDNIYLRAELVREALVLIDKFPNTNNYWHIAMLIRLLPLADKAQTKLIQQKIKAALSSEREQNILPARHKVLQILRKYSGSKTASTSILEMFVWTLSHFGINSDPSNAINLEQCIQEIVNLGRKILKHQVANACLPPEIERLLVAINNAITHIVDQYGVFDPNMATYVGEVKSMAVNNSYLHNYCIEILNSLPHFQKLHSCLKDVNWHQEIKRADFTLSFLDWYVCESLQGGENPYYPKHPKTADADGSVSVLDTEFLYKDTKSIQDSGDIHTSPVSSEKGSCFGSFSSEDLKFASEKSAEKEVAQKRIVWTKAGRVQDDVQTVNVDESQQVPSTEEMKDESNKKNEDESQDPLEKLLGEDFKKLYLNTEES